MDKERIYYNIGEEYRIQAELLERKRAARRAAARKRTLRNRITAIAVSAVIFFILAVSCDKDDGQKAQQVNAAIGNSENDEYVDENSAEIEPDSETTDTVRHCKDFAALYSVDRNTPYYAPSESGEVFMDYTDGTIDGLYTGRVSKEYTGYIEIDYKDSYVLVDSDNALAVDTARVLPVGVISQITDSYDGYSACGAACLHMLTRDLSYELTDPTLENYEELMKFAELNGYNDQGSLMSEDGGMSCYDLQRLAKDIYGLELRNAYGDAEKPSDTLRSLIDSGKQAIALCRHWNGNISEDRGMAHFILITGYVETDGKLEFLYANSFYTEYISHGNPIMHVDAESLDRSITSEFDEPNAILYVAD